MHSNLLKNLLIAAVFIRKNISEIGRYSLTKQTVSMVIFPLALHCLLLKIIILDKTTPCQLEHCINFSLKSSSLVIFLWFPLTGSPSTVSLLLQNKWHWGFSHTQVTWQYFEVVPNEDVQGHLLRPQHLGDENRRESQVSFSSSELTSLQPLCSSYLIESVFFFLEIASSNQLLYSSYFSFRNKS